MRRWVWVLAGVVVLLGGAAVVDTVVRLTTENRIAAEVTAIPGLSTRPDVTIGGFPFLTQLADGELDDVRLTAPSATVEGLLLEDVVVDLEGVRTQAPFTAVSATLTARTTPDAVERVLTVALDLELRGDRLVTTTDVLGLPLDIVLEPRAAGRDVAVEVAGLMMAGIGVDADQLPPDVAAMLTDLVVPLDGLPPGMVLTDVTVDDDGLHLRATGTGLDLTRAVAAP